MVSRVNNASRPNVIRARRRGPTLSGLPRVCATIALTAALAASAQATPGGPTLGASARLVRPVATVSAGSPTGSTVEYILITPDVRPAPLVAPPRPLPQRSPTPAPPTPSPRPRHASAATAAPPAPPPAPRAAAPTQPFAPHARGRQLGDGSVEGELLVAAQRLAGRDLGPDRSFLAHLAEVAGAALGLGDDPALHVADALATLQARGATYADDTPAPGDLVFLRLDGRLAAAVVEGTDARRRVHVVAASGARVSRVVLGGAGDRRVHAWARP